MFVAYNLENYLFEIISYEKFKGFSLKYLLKNLKHKFEPCLEIYQELKYLN